MKLTVNEFSEWLLKTLQHPDVLGLENCSNTSCRVINKNIVLVPSLGEHCVIVCMLNNGRYPKCFEITPQIFPIIEIDETNKIILLNSHLALKYEIY